MRLHLKKIVFKLYNAVGLVLCSSIRFKTRQSIYLG